MSNIVLKSVSPSSARLHPGHPRRSMLKCDCCRKSRKKCNPPKRSWPGQKCYSCEEHDLPCGPNISAKQSTTDARNESQSKTRTDSSGSAGDVLASIDIPLGCTSDNSLERWKNSQEYLADASGAILVAQGQKELTSHEFYRTDNDIPIRLGLSSNEKMYVEKLSGSVHGPQRIPSTSALIESRLSKLELLRTFSGYVEGRIVQEQGSIAKGSLQESALNDISWSLTQQRNSLLYEAVTSAIKLEDRSAESLLLRAFRVLEDIEIQETSNDKANESNSKLRKMIYRKLYSIYRARNDVPEAEYWLKKLDRLVLAVEKEDSYDIAAKLAQSLDCTSEMFRKLLDELGLNEETKSELMFSGATPAPAIHRAIYGNHLKVASILAKTSTSSRHIDLLGRTAFHISAPLGDATVFKPLDVLNQAEMSEAKDLTHLAVARHHVDTLLSDSEGHFSNCGTRCQEDFKGLLEGNSTLHDELPIVDPSYQLADCNMLGEYPVDTNSDWDQFELSTFFTNDGSVDAIQGLQSSRGMASQTKRGTSQFRAISSQSAVTARRIDTGIDTGAADKEKRINLELEDTLSTESMSRTTSPSTSISSSELEGTPPVHVSQIFDPNIQDLYSSPDLIGWPFSTTINAGNANDEMDTDMAP